MSELYNSKEELIKKRKLASNQISSEKNTIDLYNKSETVVITFESNGIFSLPPIMHFKDFTGRNISDITLSRPDDLLENLICILNERKSEDYKSIDLQNSTPEELLEILLNLRRQFISKYFTHYWVCSKCQADIDPKDQKVNETLIDIEDIHFTSIEEAEENLKKYYKETFEKIDKIYWEAYLLKKYGGDFDVNSITIEEECNKIKLTDNLIIINKNNKYELEFFRIRHAIEAKKIIEKKYFITVKQIQNRTEHNVPLAELKAKKEKELEEIEEKKAKDFISYSRALAIKTKNGNPLTNEEKIKEYENFDSSTQIELLELLEKIKFGVNDEREIACPLCKETSKRVLRREIDIRELLPTNATSEGIDRKHSTINIFIGV